MISFMFHGRIFANGTMSTNIKNMLKGINSKQTNEKDNSFNAVNSYTATTSVIFGISWET